MKTSTQVYRELKAAPFSDPQARALADILQAAGGGRTYRIERRDQCGFSRYGSVELLRHDGRAIA